MILMFHDRVFDPGGGFEAKVATAWAGVAGQAKIARRASTFCTRP